MIDIERLRVTLPPQWRGKERMFAQTVAEELAKLPFSQSVELDSLQLPTIRIQPGEPYSFVARRVARQIHGQIQSASADPYRSGESLPTGQFASTSSAPRKGNPRAVEPITMKGDQDHA